jgi:hypothetical protein
MNSGMAPVALAPPGGVNRRILMSRRMILDTGSNLFWPKEWGLMTIEDARANPGGCFQI